MVFGLSEADAEGDSAFDDAVPGESSVVEALAPARRPTTMSPNYPMRHCWRCWLTRRNCLMRCCRRGLPLLRWPAPRRHRG